MSDFDTIPELALSWATEGKQVALATVVKTWGSAPRPVGAQLVIDGDTTFQGSVSGGCVEGAVILEAVEAMRDGTCRMLSFGVTDESAFEVGLACGGEIEVMVEPVGRGEGPEIGELSALVEARAARRPVIWEVNTESWERHLRERDVANPDLEERFRTDKSVLEDGIFRGVHNPPLRLVVVGAVHIAQPLVQMARVAGYDVALCDPRDSFASATRFPDETFLEGWPDEALHREYFSVPETPDYENHDFSLRLAGTERVIEVPADTSAADALVAAGVHVDLKCSDGICGVCKCRVLEGDVEHRDFVLSKAQREHSMILCQSRAAAAGGELLIEL